MTLIYNYIPYVYVIIGIPLPSAYKQSSSTHRTPATRSVSTQILLRRAAAHLWS